MTTKLEEAQAAQRRALKRCNEAGDKFTAARKEYQAASDAYDAAEEALAEAEREAGVSG